MWQYNYTNSYELYHHGILGMKWGQRNGPPYPLGLSNHSSSEKKAGWRKSLDKSENKSYNRNNRNYYENREKFHLTDKQKKAIKIGAAVAITTLAVVGTYQLAKSGKLENLASVGKNALLGGSNSQSVEGFRQIVGKHSPEMDLAKINSSNKGRLGSDTNCLGCTMAYEARRRGIDVRASLNIDKKSGMLFSGRPMTDLTKVFKGGEIKQANIGNDWRNLDKVLSQYGNGARGTLRLQWPNGQGHFINWEVINNKAILRDGQANISFFTNNPILNSADPKYVNYMRTDNLEIVSDALREFVDEL